MRIFLVGATGYVGGAVLDALLRAGHDVTALVRDNEKAARVAARGAHPIIGNLADPESYRAAAEAQDGYIHAAIDRAPGRAQPVERIAIDTLLAAAKRPRTAGASTPSSRFVIFTSGLWVLGNTPDPATEDSAASCAGDFIVSPGARASRAGGGDRSTAHDCPASGPCLRREPGKSGDVFKCRRQRTGPCRRRRPQSLAAHLRPRSGGSLRSARRNHESATGIFHANDEGDERVNDIVASISPTCRSGLTCDTSRSKKRARRWVRTPMRSLWTRS